MALLARAIEHEIIPRLMLAHRAPNECLETDLRDAPRLGPQDVERFARLVLARDDDVAHACVEAMRGRGVPIESIYLDLLAPVARHLGELWEQDLCDFTDVTLGLGRLQQVLRELSPAFGQSIDHPTNGRRVLLLPSPGEQHTFGLVMVGEFFRLAGWDVAGGPSDAGVEPAALVRREWFDVVGFSTATDIHLTELQECIATVRQASLNPHLGIMVGGPLFAKHPECVGQVHADAAAADGRHAPILAEQLVARRAGSVVWRDRAAGSANSR
ncbi:MAG: cobalamin B12-binding domain-containing protein [Haliea sp.]|nr:MAG: cobalamin B12-binding domain-containing protein [Haliea sp.]